MFFESHKSYWANDGHHPEKSIFPLWPILTIISYDVSDTWNQLVPHIRYEWRQTLRGRSSKRGSKTYWKLVKLPWDCRIEARREFHLSFSIKLSNRFWDRLSSTKRAELRHRVKMRSHRPRTTGVPRRVHGAPPTPRRAGDLRRGTPNRRHQSDRALGLLWTGRQSVPSAMPRFVRSAGRLGSSSRSYSFYRPQLVVLPLVLVDLPPASETRESLPRPKGLVEKSFALSGISLSHHPSDLGSRREIVDGICVKELHKSWNRHQKSLWKREQTCRRYGVVS